MNNFGNALPSHTPHPDSTAKSYETLVRRDMTDRRNLLARILDTPHLAQIVPQLQPELLHRVIQHCGLEDCSEIVALTTTEQLAHVFDLDLWRAAQPGLDEQFDAERFGVWIEVLLESGAATAAQKLAGIDAELVIAGLAQHALVYDRVAVTPYETLDGELITFYAEAISVFDEGLTFDLGSYFLIAKRADSWEAIVEVLMSLSEEHSDYFHQVMKGCCILSNSGFEIDGLDNLLQKDDQVMFDLSEDREGRREKQGYVMPAQARAFLQVSRQLRVDDALQPKDNSLARAYFRAISDTPAADANSASSPAELLAGSQPQPVPEEFAESVGAVYELLLDAGIIPQQPRAMLTGLEEHTSRLNEIKMRLEIALDQDYAAYLARNEELAYLANVMMAGCSLQARPFTAHEASDAAVAVCNLGLENWPTHWLPTNTTALPISFLVTQDLISVFQVGWKILYDNVGMYAAKQLIEVLKRMRCNDREIQMGLDALRIELAKHCQADAPWRAKDALDVIAILDTPAWAALLTLIDECPTLHAVVGASKDARTLSVNASDFKFISENSQIASVREFIRSLPETLCL